jgi:hypothetical protein
MLAAMRTSTESTERWRALLAEQRGSGLSIAAFCRRAGVPLSSFYAWRRKLERVPVFAEARIVADSPDGSVADGLDASTAHGGPRTSSADALEVRLPDGPSIVVRPGFDPLTLRALLETLRTTAPGAETEASS